MNYEDKILEHINNYFSINEDTGEIKRTDRRNSNGSLDKDGYLIYKIKSKQIKSHRLAWYLYYGKFPEKEIDHIDRDKLNNSKNNLREATRRQNVNNINRKKNKETGLFGVYIDKTKGLKKKFATKVNKKTYRFYTKEQAIKFKQNHGYTY